MNILELNHLTKTYPDFQLRDLSLVLPAGCILGLVGKNGAGKSTTIKLILDMIDRDAGSVTIFGRDNKTGIRDLKEDIGIVLDEVGIPAGLTAKQVGKIMAGTFRNWNPAVYSDYLSKLSVPANKEFRHLSRGMKMKLGLAIALSHDPKLLILDEATSGLDPVVRDEVVEMIGEFTRNEDHAVLISSHIVSDLEKICDYIAFLDNGSLLLCEEKDRLLDSYGMIHCTPEDLQAMDPAAILHRRESYYAIDAIVRRDAVPTTTPVTPITLEELFIAMVKEG